MTAALALLRKLAATGMLNDAQVAVQAVPAPERVAA